MATPARTIGGLALALSIIGCDALKNPLEPSEGWGCVAKSNTYAVGEPAQFEIAGGWPDWTYDWRVISPANDGQPRGVSGSKTFTTIYSSPGMKTVRAEREDKEFGNGYAECQVQIR